MFRTEEMIFVPIIWVSSIGFSVILDSIGFSQMANFIMLICLITGATMMAIVILYYLDNPPRELREYVLPMYQRSNSPNNLRQVVVDSSTPTIVHDYFIQEHN